LEIWNIGDFVKKNLSADIGLSYAICTVVMLMLYRSCRSENKRKVAMVGTTIATVILTEVCAVANLGCQAFLRTRFFVH
jgi:uncharacterized BrkB/YihY/UPF0761 family membrane protein